MNTSMPLVDGVVLERANHFEAGTVTDVGQAGVRVTAEVMLQDSPIAVRSNRAPHSSSSRTRSGAS